ncbi:MAG: hypothetical protein RPS47_13855 [Colwellia sp.]|jgi:hypothetical protein
MRIDGKTKSGTRTSIQINQDYFNLSVLSFAHHMCQQAAYIHVKKLMKDALYNEKHSKELRKEIFKEILNYLKQTKKEINK